jgi:hypothetical protein
MKTKYLSLSIILFFVLSLVACIDPYEVDFGSGNKILVVEGFLTDDIQNADTIKIRYSIYNNQQSIFISPIENVKVSVFTTVTKEETKLVDLGKGRFLPPKGFKVKSSEKYVLKFTLPDGQQYESTPQGLVPTPPIERVYEQFNPKSRLSEDGKTFRSANEVFIDFKDPPNQKNFYLWRFTHYERVQYCATCYQSLLDYSTGGCTIKSAIDYFDYPCDGECYEIFRDKKLNIFSDVVSDGKVISGRLIAKIPVFYTAGCLVEVQQVGISYEAYSIYKILQAQTQTNGGLADTPPEAIVGNISNISNPGERIVGFFSIGNIQKKQIWLDRLNTVGTPIDLVLGHKIVLEPPTPFRPPSARCKPSTNRTPFKPEGWQD